MKQPVYFWNSLLWQEWLLEHILMLLVVQNFLLMKIKGAVLFFKKLLTQTNLNHLNHTLIYKESLKMTTVNHITTKQIEFFQRKLKEKYDLFESSYYESIDELIEKLKDSETSTDIPDLSYINFTFLLEWESGNVDSSYVNAILKSFNIEEIAKKRMTNKLKNLMFKVDEDKVDLYKYTIAQITEKVVPIYAVYLKMLSAFFNRLTFFDETQPKLTWLDITIEEDNQVKKKIEDMTYNQVIRTIDTFLIPITPSTYFVGNNIICFDECNFNEERRVHWIFGPKAFILSLKKMYNIKNKVDVTDDGDYIKTLISEYLK